MEKYIRKFPEMAFSADHFENSVIKPYALNIVKHFIKLKLCDKSFSDLFDKDLYPFIVQYKGYWIDDIFDFIKAMFNDMQESSIAKKDKSRVSKEELYLSCIDNVFILLSSQNEALKAIKDGTTKFKNHDEVVDKAKRFLAKTRLREFDWIMDCYFFLYELSPTRNAILDNDAIKEAYDKFIKNFSK
jgi:hypothetical protein